jgi:metallophosphoesterase (TIGR03767 family)
MGGLTRRAFLATVAGLSAAWALPRDAVAMLLTEAAQPSDAPSTLQQTIRIGSVQKGSYRTLAPAAGEAYYPRIDLLREIPDPGRSERRRSLAYIAHLSDMHIIDAQSPARLEPMIAQDHSLWAGCFRPQDTLTTHVGAAMVQAIAALRTSPVTGAPMSAAFVTGDSTDMLSHLETRWYIDLLDGTPVVPNSGRAGVYDGVQAWPEATYAYHPEDPGNDQWGTYGFPAVPGLLDAAVTQEVASGGLPVPWFSVYGNHDVTYLGTLGVPPGLRAFAVGDRKASEWWATAGSYVGQWAAATSVLGQVVQAATTNLGVPLGMRAVTSDPERRMLERQQFMEEHLTTSQDPGPVGHGFTPEAIASGRTYWSTDLGPFARAFGLDTCNWVAGPDGALPQDQLDWLTGELDRCQQEQRLALLFSHHNSYTLENDAQLATEPQRLVHSEEFIATMLRYPCVIAWINGHTHINTITAHRREDGIGGFWELTTASCIDFPQQQQVIDVVDNRDGSLSLFATTLDHAGPAKWDGDLSVLGLASLSRELSANDWVEEPPMRLGSELDRNVELLLPAPFDTGAYDPAVWERSRANDVARLAAWESGWSS